MRNILSIVILIFLSDNLLAQQTIAKDSALFDFWVGEWDASWTNEDGTRGTAHNSIKKILDGKVIQESFVDPQGFKGTSISVYNPQRKTWHQAWADNQGGYFNFLGEVDGNKRIFRTPTREVGGKAVTQRMIFYDITGSSMTWDWELSNDGGKTWKLQWRINYTRKQ
ncbi:MAG TPA: hypothetical protein PK325_06960 [Cyclobacteriaceae bacterium]|nr:DUF1579 domain-containing protein [Cyclobacteriaceae bacterium]HMV09444.1 hypothetical protein [Cyclobacteriaceae bacterium]HMV89469.1 hypothetical protein [Cyclobacteriaceae bacterium]HMX02465.1 hypothetical protein [Cyclobacteriaceae bacterium]HMX51047.1 hypothetical protein [Cyclobacteriaceae bacterium]